MAGRKSVRVPDYEKLVIYPGEYTIETRRKLYQLMRRLGIQVIYDRYG